jgi:hypothetical protein
MCQVLYWKGKKTGDVHTKEEEGTPLDVFVKESSDNDDDSQSPPLQQTTLAWSCSMATVGKLGSFCIEASTISTCSTWPLTLSAWQSVSQKVRHQLSSGRQQQMSQASHVVFMACNIGMRSRQDEKAAGNSGQPQQPTAIST